MVKLIRAVFSDDGARLGKGIRGVYALLICFNIGAWAWAIAAFHHYPLLLGSCFLAYSLGLRHAVDADHIAAIDNVTRKLMQAGKRPITVGLMFSLGHSTIVILACVGIAATALALQTHMAGIKEIGSMIGTVVSTMFLLLIAAINLVVLRSLLRTFSALRRGGNYHAEDLDLLLAGGGLLARVFRPAFRLVTKSWHMYFLGFLFGLGFDTASEVGLLGIAAAGAAQQMSVWSILVFPTLFTAGMSLVDTTDGILMMGVYQWAFVNPIRKLYYNITITTVSVMIAVAIACIEGLGLLADRLHLNGPVWDVVGILNSQFGLIGYAIIAIFLLSCVVSMAFYRWKRLEEPLSR